MKILILALSGNGDALMFTPALKLLKTQFPEAEIDVLAMFKTVEELYARNPNVSNVYFHDFLKKNPASSLLKVLQLRFKNYDASINVYPANRREYNIMSRLIGAKKRLGHEYNHENDKQLSKLNNLRVLENDKLHNVEENIRLIKLLKDFKTPELPPMEIFLKSADETAADNWFLKNNLLKTDTLVGFHAGTQVLKNHIKRRWAPEKFAESGKNLQAKFGAKILLFGGPDEYELNESIAQMMGGDVFIVKERIMPGAAIMKNCKLFVANDSALMHFAAALKIPTVAIFAYTNPNYVHPWKTEYKIVRKDLPCSPCFYYSPKPATCIWTGEDEFKCNWMIQPDEVLNACEELLRS
ncbi:MAG: glycosyltransferase family 9 protein [Bacteroidota bacterium]